MTHEEKAQFRAQYLGQHVLATTTERQETFIQKLTSDWLYFGQNDYFLVLKPLSAITDEHAIECAKMSRRGNSFTEVRQWVVSERNSYYIVLTATDTRYHDYKARFVLHTKWFGVEIYVPKYPDGRAQSDQVGIYQFLQSEGYAMGYKNWNVNQLIELGLIKLS